LEHDEQQIDLPAPAEELRAFLIATGFAPRPGDVLLREIDCTPINEQGKQLLIELSSYESLAMANLGCTLLTVPEITGGSRQRPRPAAACSHAVPDLLLPTDPAGGR